MPSLPPASNRLRTVLLAAVMVPPAVLLHELGHWVGYVAAGLPSPSLHYSFTGFRQQPQFWAAVRQGDMALAETIGSVTGAGLAALLGIAVSWGLMIGGAWLARRPAFRVATGAMVFASAVRFVPVTLFLLRGQAEHTDEAHVAQALFSPAAVWILIPLGVAIAALSIAAVVRTLPRGSRRATIVDLVAGVAVGTVAWLGFVGPAVLP